MAKSLDLFNIILCYLLLRLQIVQERCTGEINQMLRIKRIRFPNGNDSQSQTVEM